MSHTTSFFSEGSSQTVIVKLGGAVITNKSGICEFPAAEEEEDHLYAQIAQAYRHLLETRHNLILIHGAGSFGHPQAKEYHLKDGWSAAYSSPALIPSFEATDRSTCISDQSSLEKPSAHYRKGFSRIRCSLQKLNHHVVSRLEKHNVPVLALPPIDFIELSDNNGEEEDLGGQAYGPIIERVRKYLSLGFVPVLHGDAVFDIVRGCTILSGDAIMYQLAKHIPTVHRCVFLTDVDGVYRDDPKRVKDETNNPLYQLITVDENGSLDKLSYFQTDGNSAEAKETAKVADVTGGMDGKLRCAKRITLIQDNGVRREGWRKQRVEAVICRAGSVAAYQMMVSADILLNHTDQQRMTTFTIKAQETTNSH